jgi:hypothetical protein
VEKEGKKVKKKERRRKKRYRSKEMGKYSVLISSELNWHERDRERIKKNPKFKCNRVSALIVLFLVLLL